MNGGMETTEESKGLKPRTWNAISAGVLLLAIAVGIILYVVTGDLIDVLAAILVFYGAYMAVASFAKKGGEDNFGPSAADATMAGGAVLAGVGLAMFAYSFSGDVLITVAVLIVVVAIVGILLALKNKDV